MDNRTLDSVCGCYSICWTAGGAVFEKRGVWECWDWVCSFIILNFLETFWLLSAVIEGASLFIQSSGIVCYLYVCVVCTYYVGKSSKHYLKFDYCDVFLLHVKRFQHDYAQTCRCCALILHRMILLYWMQYSTFTCLLWLACLLLVMNLKKFETLLHILWLKFYFYNWFDTESKKMLLFFLKRQNFSLFFNYSVLKCI